MERSKRRELGKLASKLSRKLSGKSSDASSTAAAEGDGLLLVLDPEECGGAGRLLQQELAQRLECDVGLSSGSVDAWRSEVAGAGRGVVLLQTKSVLRHPVRAARAPRLAAV